MKQVATLGGLLALTLVASWLTWTAPEEEAPAGDVVALRADAAALASLTWKADDKTITLTRESDARGNWFKVVAVEKKKAKAAAEREAEGLAEAEAEESTEALSAEAGEVEETTTFAAGPDAEKVWKAFTPLYALRELHLGADSDPKTYGLDAPSASIEVSLAGGRTVTVELGGEAYGTRDRYARIDGRVFLLDDDALRPLQFATTRLVERRVHPYDEAKIATVAVTYGGETRRFVQVNASDRAKAFWADAGSPAERDVEATTWLGKLFRMRVRGYEPVDLATLQPVFSFTVEGDDGAVWAVDVKKTAGEPADYWAVPEWTRMPVSLTRSLSEEAIADLPTLFDGVQAAPEEEEQDEARFPVPGEDFGGQDFEEP